MQLPALNRLAGGIKGLLEVTRLGAKGDGTTDDTGAFVSALSKSRHVIVPPGNFLIGSVAVPAGTTLELLAGAVLTLAGTLFLDGNRTRLLGWTAGVTGLGSDIGANVKWAGADNGTILLTGRPTTPVGQLIRGISIDGGGPSHGCLGIQFGTDDANAGTTWLKAEHVFVGECLNGIDIHRGNQQMRLSDIHVRVKGTASMGIGLGLGARANIGGNIGIWIKGLTVEGYLTNVQAGGPASNQIGPSDVTIADAVYENGVTNGVALNLVRGGPFLIEDTFTEGNGIDTRALLVGGVGTAVEGLIVRNNYWHGHKTIVEGFGWRGLRVEDNRFDLSGGAFTALKNTGGGSVRAGGRWLGNEIVTGLDSIESSGGLSGFELTQLENVSGGFPAPSYDLGTAVSQVSCGGLNVQLGGGAGMTFLPQSKTFAGDNQQVNIEATNPGGSASLRVGNASNPGTSPFWDIINNNGEIGWRADSGLYPMWIKANGNIGIGGDTNPANILTVPSNSATDPIAHAWTTYSSRRWKENIRPLSDALTKVLALAPVSYVPKWGRRTEFGLVAEDAGRVVPEVVEWEENGVDATSIDYARLTALLIGAVKEQQAEIKLLREAVDELRKGR